MASQLAGALKWRCRCAVSCWTFARSQISRRGLSRARSRASRPSRYTHLRRRLIGRTAGALTALSPLSFGCDTCVIVHDLRHARSAVSLPALPPAPCTVPSHLSHGRSSYVRLAGLPFISEQRRRRRRAGGVLEACSACSSRARRVLVTCSSRA